jgi:hypothetical protein
MTKVIPIFRIFDYDKAIEFYINWLGFKIDWEDKTDNLPIYMQVSLGDIVLHLSEHHGDCTPGSRVFISGFDNLAAYHKKLTDANYKYNRPGLKNPFWNPEALSMEVIDPFGSRLTFNNI